MLQWESLLAAAEIVFSREANSAPIGGTAASLLLFFQTLLSLNGSTLDNRLCLIFDHLPIETNSGHQCVRCRLSHGHDSLDLSYDQDRRLMIVLCTQC